MNRLKCKVTTDPDFSGFRFYVEAGREFDVFDYAKACGLQPDSFEPNDVGSVKFAARCLKGTEWLEVFHESEE